MNHHLNLFRFYNENQDQEFIENNLSRALAICLKSSNIFLNEFLKTIVTNEDHDYLFKVYSPDTTCEVDIQIDMNNIDQYSYKKAYAVAITSNKHLDISLFDSCKTNRNKQKNVCDIFISLKDIAIVIEVKRTGEDCVQQLYNQVCLFKKEENNLPVIPKSLPWQSIISIAEKAANLQRFFGNYPFFLNDFIQLSETRYPEWFEPKPFSVLPFSSKNDSSAHYHLTTRLRQALVASGYEVLGYSDRLGIVVPFKWASEILPYFETHDKEQYLVFYIWPGNTKGQGYNIFYKPINWINADTVTIDGKNYEMEIAYQIKFCHFNRYIISLVYYDKDINIETHTKENFEEYSGKWNEDDWDEFEEWMDKHFKAEFNWREKSDWKANFLDTGRSYFTISLCFEVSVYLPYTELQEIDKNEDGFLPVGKKIGSIASALKNVVENN
jgi:hypothetical protein